MIKNDNKQPLGLKTYENDKSKPKSTWGTDNKFGCHDQQVLH